VKLERDRTEREHGSLKKSDRPQQISAKPKDQTRCKSLKPTTCRQETKGQGCRATRESLKTLNATAGALRTEVSLSSTAKKSNCNGKTLLGMKVSCPKTRSAMIGKERKHHEEYHETSNVSVVVDRDYGNITMLGLPRRFGPC
jgi:hypothetical protein